MGKKSYNPVDGIKVNGVMYKISRGYDRINISEDGTVKVSYSLLFPMLHYYILGGKKSSPPDGTWNELFNSGK